ncbi:MAG: DUF4236 domain-containing protein [Kouleothrix sp.]|nr:DUF4236 domain-containing protein [Kouleothrix sp.]
MRMLRALWRGLRRGATISIGAPGRRLTVSRHGLTLSVGLPGTGLFWSWRRLWRRRRSRRRRESGHFSRNHEGSKKRDCGR